MTSYIIGCLIAVVISTLGVRTINTWDCDANPPLTEISEHVQDAEFDIVDCENIEKIDQKLITKN